MRLVLLGAPGAGKGTQAGGLARRYEVPHISTGDMFREHGQLGTPLGLKIARFMQSGQLVPDDLVLEMVEERLTREDARRGFVCDGFPRTLPQAESFARRLASHGLALDGVVLLEVPFQALIRRLCLRRVCPRCGALYHLEDRPPRQAGLCDADGSVLLHREDDHEEIIRERLEVYQQQTAPLVAFYEKATLLFRVDSARPVENIRADLYEILDPLYERSGDTR